MRWYVNRKGVTEGPFEEPAILEMIKSSKDMRFAAFRAEDGGAWMKFEASPFAGVQTKSKAEHVTWKQALVVVGGLVAVLTYLNYTDKYRVRTPDESLPSASSTSSQDDGDARDTANAIRVTYPAFCDVAAARSKWDHCHDHTKGYAAILKCAQEAKAAANAATSPTPQTTSMCGHSVVSSTGTIIRGVRLYLADTVTWLTVNAPTLKKALASKSLHEACDDIDCTGAPNDHAEGEYASASFLPLTTMECTKTLFQCGEAKDNVCWLQKVASRLGVACEGDPAGDTLYVRSSGTRVH